MKKFLFYAMREEKMCFLHVLMNALDLHESGNEVRIIFEGASVKLPSLLEEEKHPLYKKAKEKGLIEGVCLACSKTLGVWEKNREIGIDFLDDMNGHAGMKAFVDRGYEVVSM